MLEKPRIADEKISACLSDNYGLAVTGLEFLPLGYDANAGVYRVRAGGATYFLKVKRDTVYEASLSLPHYLKAQGIEQVVPPLPTTNQQLWSRADHFNLILYPFIETVEAKPSDRQWIELGTVLKRIHAMRLPPELMSRIPQETFIPPPKYKANLRQLEAAIGHQDYDNPFEKQLAAFWKDQQHEINLIVDRVEQLGRALHTKPLVRALCHADIHTGNLLLTPQGQLFVVDWDQPVLAPQERDLMFVTVGDYVTDERVEALFFQGYGKTEIDPLTMAYYRYERVMEDLSEFAVQVFSTEASDETKADSLRWFTVQFEPGSGVATAHKLDHVLSL